MVVLACWAVLAVACDGGSDNAASTPTLGPASTATGPPVATTLPPVQTITAPSFTRVQSPTPATIRAPSLTSPPGVSPTPTPASLQRPSAAVTTVPTPTPASALSGEASPTPTPPLLIPTPSPTTPPTPAPSLTAVASATPALGGAQGVVAAEIVAFSPSDLIEVDVGQSVALSVTVLNTGTEAHRFTVTAILLHGTDGPVATLQSAMAESLMPGRRRTVQWSYTVDRPGDFFVHYLLLNGEGTLLDQAPATPQKLVVGRALPTPTATATPVASSSGQPPPTPKPTQVAAAAPTPTPTLVPIAAADTAIVGFSPASVTNVEVGQSLTVSVTVSNTGQVARQFAVGATVLNSGGTAVGDYMTTLGVSLQPGEQTVVMWDHAVSSPGDYRVQFSVWESAPATAQNLLDQEPTAPQVLIAAAFAPTPSPTPQATPSAVPTPVSSPTPIATPTEPGAEIVSHGPSTVQFVQVGQSVFLSATDWNAATPVSVSAATTTDDINFTLVGGGSTSGTVYVSNSSSTPLAGANVWASDFYGSGGHGWARTRVDGTYTIEGLAAGDYRVAAQFEGLVHKIFDDTTQWDLATPVTVIDGQNTTGTDFTLVSGGTITGTVYDGAMNPVVGAGIHANNYDGEGGWGWAETGRHLHA